VPTNQFTTIINHFQANSCPELQFPEGDWQCPPGFSISCRVLRIPAWKRPFPAGFLIFHQDLQIPIGFCHFLSGKVITIAHGKV
jgi:hypothetical protein